MTTRQTALGTLYIVPAVRRQETGEGAGKGKGAGEAAGGTHNATQQAREACMRRHPAGKGRV